ncbi:hypothetical protein GCM10009716_08100 [Streptomyces sodiiphilus]|uniref:Uncharacterized protein n=1 Tax=Streptomyces sodiiphilus TaxID=226217 RepID=A0ABP5A281_9ACTN
MPVPPEEAPSGGVRIPGTSPSASQPGTFFRMMVVRFVGAGDAHGDVRLMTVVRADLHSHSEGVEVDGVLTAVPQSGPRQTEQGGA